MTDGPFPHTPVPGAVVALYAVVAVATFLGVAFGTGRLPLDGPGDDGTLGFSEHPRDALPKDVRNAWFLGLSPTDVVNAEGDGGDDPILAKERDDDGEDQGKGKEESKSKAKKDGEGKSKSEKEGENEGESESEDEEEGKGKENEKAADRTIPLRKMTARTTETP